MCQLPYLMNRNDVKCNCPMPDVCHTVMSQKQSPEDWGFRSLVSVQVGTPVDIRMYCIQVLTLLAIVKEESTSHCEPTAKIDILNKIPNFLQTTPSIKRLIALPIPNVVNETRKEEVVGAFSISTTVRCLHRFTSEEDLARHVNPMTVNSTHSAGLQAEAAPSRQPTPRP